MVLARSDRGIIPPAMFKQADDQLFFTSSPKNRYDDKVQKDLHGKAKESRIHDAIQIETYVSTFMLPDRFTEENIELKQAILDCD